MKPTPELSAQMAQLVKEAISHIKNVEEEEIITDFHITGNVDSGDVDIFDDNDILLAHTTIEGCEELDEDDFMHFLAIVLKEELHKLSTQKAFDSLNLFRPYSFVLVDSMHETLEELFVVDDDTVIVTSKLMEGLDKDLDDFIRDLLSA